MKNIRQNTNADAEEINIYEKTVYGLNATLIKENLTNKGDFDLGKIHSLRVIDNGFLKKLGEKSGKTQKELSTLTGIPLRTLVGWTSYKKAIPLQKLNYLTKKLGIENDTLYGLIKNCEFTFGNHHGKNRMNLPLRPNEFHLVHYLIPQENGRVYVVKNCPNNVKEEIIKNFSIDKSYYQKTGLIVIYSCLLNSFLTTFYEYDKELLLKFPLSEEVQDWKQKGIDLKSIIIALLLTDGGEQSKNRMFFSGASEILHHIWSDAWFYEYGLLPSSFCIKHKSIFVTTHNIPNNMLSELKALCPLFKTSPSYETNEEYLAKVQPSIKFLFDRPEIEQHVAIRLWANTEGSIGIQPDKDSGLITPSLKIACTNPALIKELRYICNLNDIHMSITNSNKTWSNVHALKSNSIKTAIRFLSIGGFINGTKIASTRSVYFGGLDKQEILLSILEFVVRQRNNHACRTSDIHKIYKAIQKIAVCKEYKSAEYYLNIFKDYDNWSFRRELC